MQFIPKLLLTTLICATGAQLTHCSQVQSSSAIATQAAPAVMADQKQAIAQAVLQATGQDIVERDAKRVKLSAEEEKQKAEKREKNWLLSYAKKLSSEAKQKLEAAETEAIKNERGTILPAILYDLLTCMPRELTNLIASYDEPYHLKGVLDQTFKITLPQNVTITAMTPMVLLHGTKLVVGYSNGYLQIFKEQTDKEAKERWALEQTIQADKSAVTTIADLKNQKFATGATSGDLKIWTFKQNSKEYSCDAAMATGIPIKKIATLSNGNIVVGGSVVLIQRYRTELLGHWQIWDPVTLKKLHSHSMIDDRDDMGLEIAFIDLLVLPDDRIMVNLCYKDLAIYKQTKTNGWVEETAVKSHIWCEDLRSLTLLPNNDILRCLDLKDGRESSLKKQIRILDHDNYDLCSLILQFDQRAGEYCGPTTILPDGKLAASVKTRFNHRKTHATDNIKIFDTSDIRYQLRLDDNILAIPLSDYKSELQYLITLPDGRLLAAFKDGTISIWR